MGAYAETSVLVDLDLMMIPHRTGFVFLPILTEPSLRAC
jgi:hypothetical protein